ALAAREPPRRAAGSVRRARAPAPPRPACEPLPRAARRARGAPAARAARPPLEPAGRARRLGRAPRAARLPRPLLTRGREPREREPQPLDRVRAPDGLVVRA